MPPLAPPTAPVVGLDTLRDHEFSLSILRLISLTYGRELIPNPASPSYEAYLAQVGKYVYGHTYAKGLTDQETVEWLSQWRLFGDDKELVDQKACVMYDPAGPLHARFAARWFDQAMPVVLLPQTYAAGLMATTAPEALVSDLTPPWRAFSIRLDAGLLPHEDVKPQDGAGKVIPWLPKDWSVVRINVLHETLEGAEYWTLDVQTQNRSLFLHRVSAQQLLHAAEVDDVQHPHNPALANGPEDHRVLELSCRLVIGLCLSLVGNQDTRREWTRQGKSGGSNKRRGPPSAAIRLIKVGSPLEIDLRDEVRAYARGARPAQRAGVSPGVQTLVRWHWKRQRYGAGNALVKWIRVSPYLRGGEDKPVLVRPVAVRA